MTKLAIEDLKQALKRLPDWQLAKDREARYQDGEPELSAHEYLRDEQAGNC